MVKVVYSYLYFIRSLVTADIYIGRTKNFGKRFKQHCWVINQIKREKIRGCQAPRLADYVLRFGDGALLFEIYKVCESGNGYTEELRALEQFNPSLNSWRFENGQFKCRPIAPTLTQYLQCIQGKEIS